MKIADFIIGKISDPETKAKVVAKLNEDVNIPILNEKTEEKIFSALYDVVVNVLESGLKI